MKNVKQFINKHKKGIVITTGVGCLAVSAILIKKYTGVDTKVEKTIKEYPWGSKVESMLLNTEQVIDYVLNCDDNDKYAIFKESDKFEIVRNL